MTNFRGRKVLVLAPHTDDAELGVGGTIAKMKREGAHISVVAFSAAEESLPKEFKKGTTLEEFNQSMKFLGVDYFTVFDFKVRHFPSCRQSILDKLIRLRTQLNPDIVFCPCSQDVHQDHSTIYSEALRAFKSCSILGYEMPWNTYTRTANLFFMLPESDVKKKLSAISFYKSQLAKESIYLNDTFVLSQLKINAAGVGATGYAESFELIRWIER